MVSIVAVLCDLTNQVFGFGSLCVMVERRLAGDYAVAIETLLAQLSADNLAQTIEFAELPAGIRGYGHIKKASIAKARAREAQLCEMRGPDR